MPLIQVNLGSAADSDFVRNESCSRRSFHTSHRSGTGKTSNGCRCCCSPDEHALMNKDHFTTMQHVVQPTLCTVCLVRLQLGFLLSLLLHGRMHFSIQPLNSVFVDKRVGCMITCWVLTFVTNAQTTIEYLSCHASFLFSSLVTSLSYDNNRQIRR